MNRVTPNVAIRKHYDLVIVGSGFGSLFFLQGLLMKDRRMQVLLLERGQWHSHAWQIENQKNSEIKPEHTFVTSDAKRWNFSIALGGGTNCWFAQTPRLHPSDFELRTRYGVGQDWPIGYSDLEEYYCQAEEIMSVSGDPDMNRQLPRSRPFPQPPHRLSAPDALMKRARPDVHFVMPTARARVPTRNRPACCATYTCHLCPINAKFTALNELAHLFSDPRVDICLGARVERFEIEGGSIRSVQFESENRRYSVVGDLFVLGANAIHSPFILLRSGIDDPLVGKGLNEQVGVGIEVLLDGVDNFGGSTITTGLNYGFYDGEFRREHASALVYFDNRWTYGFRAERGKWRQTLPLIIVAEDLPQDTNYVKASAGETLPRVVHPAISEYARRGIDRALRDLPDLLSPLPIERIDFRGWRPTESHLLGTVRMGRTPADSVIDSQQVHHQYRNLVVVGTSVFPSSACANPSLTAAALSLRCADKIFS